MYPIAKAHYHKEDKRRALIRPVAQRAGLEWAEPQILEETWKTM
jgi:hypothetical protein